MPQPLLGAWPSSQILTVGSLSAEPRSLVLCVGATSGRLEPAEWGHQARSLGHPRFLAWETKCSGICVRGNNKRHAPLCDMLQTNQPAFCGEVRENAG